MSHTICSKTAAAPSAQKQLSLYFGKHLSAYFLKQLLSHLLQKQMSGVCAPSLTPSPTRTGQGKELVGAIEVVQTSECSIILGLNVYIHYFSIYKCEMFRYGGSLVGSMPLGANST